MFFASVSQALEQYRADNGVFPEREGVTGRTGLWSLGPRKAGELYRALVRLFIAGRSFRFTTAIPVVS